MNDSHLRKSTDASAVNTADLERVELSPEQIAAIQLLVEEAGGIEVAREIIASLSGHREAA